MHPDRLFFCAFVDDMDVRNREAEARRRPAKLASDNHALDGPRRGTSVSNRPGSARTCVRAKRCPC